MKQPVYIDDSITIYPTTSWSKHIIMFLTLNTGDSHDDNDNDSANDITK